MSALTVPESESGSEPPQSKKQKLMVENGHSEENVYSSEKPMPEGETVLGLRKQHIAPSKILQYGDYPLHIVSGKGAYFFDEHGQEYLDTTNNVACVGHSHPKVTEASSRQMSVLCTNARFLNERMCTYAKRLCSTFPEELTTCFFANSGSEANDLALQLARVYTGREHVISLHGCYHGHLTSLKPLSSYKLAGGVENSPDVSFASLPDVYRGKYRDPDTAGPLYAEEIKEILAAQKAKGKDVAAFIHETMPSCAGQIIPPKGYLAESYKHVHEAGGVVIADEVQTGFARMGDHFWAFQIYDIVTIGKPMGNGHPVSAVVTTKAIAEKFAARGVEYFNSFGGNPVSMAIADAVLDVIEEESLQQNAKEVGQFLKEGLQALQDKHACIGDVRGVGLYIGVDFVKDKETREADKNLANIIKYRLLKEHRVITHMDGMELNVLKIKPPLVVSKEDCTRIIQALDSVLSS